MLLPMVSVSPSVAVALAHMVAPVIRYSESRAPSRHLVLRDVVLDARLVLEILVLNVNLAKDT